MSEKKTHAEQVEEAKNKVLDHGKEVVECAKEVERMEARLVRARANLSEHHRLHNRWLYKLADLAAEKEKNQ